RQIIEAILEGKDVLGVLPTGYGKSACYQIPGLVKNDITLVISPLIALQEDQIAKLRAKGIHAYAIHSNMPQAKRNAARLAVKMLKNQPRFLYLSPEMLLNREFHAAFNNVEFGRLAIDEAHCVSTWGDSFGPDYQRIQPAVEQMHVKSICAFTATVDPKI